MMIRMTAAMNVKKNCMSLTFFTASHVLLKDRYDKEYDRSYDAKCGDSRHKTLTGHLVCYQSGNDIPDRLNVKRKLLQRLNPLFNKDLQGKTEQQRK